MRDSAQVRVDLALEFMSNEGIAGAGEVGDGDPLNAVKDAVAAHGIDEIIVSTLPSESSGWLRRDLPERLREETGLPVEHVVVDLVAEGLPFDVTLVLANQTAASPELTKRLEALAEEGPHRFIVVVPQPSTRGDAVAEARERLRRLLESLRKAGIVAAGHDRRPRPLHGGDERGPVLPHLRDRRLDAARGQLAVDGRQARRARSRARRTSRSSTSSPRPTRSPPERRPSDGSRLDRRRARRQRGHDEEHHHGPPEANRSSRVEPQLLGMLLFIISEIMVFGAFFTAYFFIRVVGGAEWPAEGTELPKLIALRQHVHPRLVVADDALGARGRQARATASRCRRASLTTFLLGATFLFVQINEYVHIGFAPQDHAQGTIFYGLTGLHGAHVFIGLTLLLFTTIRAFRGHFTPAEHRGVEVPGIYWHFVDVMWVIVYTDGLHPVINPLRSEAEAFRFLLYVIAVAAVDRRARPARPRRLLSPAGRAAARPRPPRPPGAPAPGRARCPLRARVLDELLRLGALAHPAREQPAEHADRHDRALDHPDRAGQALVLGRVDPAARGRAPRSRDRTATSDQRKTLAITVPAKRTHDARRRARPRCRTSSAWAAGRAGPIQSARPAANIVACSVAWTTSECSAAW